MDDDLARRIRAKENERSGQKQRYDEAHVKCGNQLVSLNKEIARLANSVPGMEHRQSWYYPAESSNPHWYPDQLEEDMSWTAWWAESDRPRICTPIGSIVSYNPFSGHYFHAHNGAEVVLGSRAALLVHYRNALAAYTVEMLPGELAASRAHAKKERELAEKLRFEEAQKRAKQIYDTVSGLVIFGLIVFGVIATIMWLWSKLMAWSPQNGFG